MLGTGSFSTRAAASKIKDLETGKHTPLKRGNGVFVMDMWVQPPPSARVNTSMCPNEGDGTAQASVEGGLYAFT